MLVTAARSTCAFDVQDPERYRTTATYPDGSPASLTSTHGPFGATLPAGSTPDTGIFVLSGHGASVIFNADGTRIFQVGPSGSVIDVCAELD